MSECHRCAKKMDGCEACDDIAKELDADRTEWVCPAPSCFACAEDSP